MGKRNMQMRANHMGLGNRKRCVYEIMPNCGRNIHYKTIPERVNLPPYSDKTLKINFTCMKYYNKSKVRMIRWFAPQI